MKKFIFPVSTIEKKTKKKQIVWNQCVNGLQLLILHTLVKDIKLCRVSVAKRCFVEHFRGKMDLIISLMENGATAWGYIAPDCRWRCCSRNCGWRWRGAAGPCPSTSQLPASWISCRAGTCSFSPRSPGCRRCPPRWRLARLCLSACEIVILIVY